MKRPKTRSAVPAENFLHRDDPAYWESRVFQNAYRYRGERRLAKRWSVKIQHRGVRRTIPLEAGSRPAAATEACRLFRLIVDRGWEGLEPRRTAGRSNGSVPPRTGDNDPLKPGYWRPRLIRRKYLNWLGQQAGPGGEWSVVIEHEGRQTCFPLRTNDPDQAALAAVERFATIVRQGWKHAFLLHPREITLGVFWGDNPFACTYTTLLSFPANTSGETPPPARTEKPRRIVILEPDGGVRRALVYWLSRQTLFNAEVTAAGRASEVRGAAWSAAELILINRNLGDEAVGTKDGSSDVAGEEPVKFEYGVFEDSDHIFASLSGIAGGYFMRRRAPADLLEPLGRFPDDRRLTRRRALGGVRRYFQGLFNDPQGGDERSEPLPLLTHREYDILSLVGKGFQDKEIADRMNISIWTVHSHLRSIFEKYQVHSRTEAVVKYLQAEPAYPEG